MAACEIRVREENGIRLGIMLTHPTHHTVVFSGPNVAHETMQLTVTVQIPLGNVPRKRTDRAKQVKSSHARAIKDFHQDS